MNPPNHLLGGGGMPPGITDLQVQAMIKDQEEKAARTLCLQLAVGRSAESPDVEEVVKTAQRYGTYLLTGK